VLLPIGLESSQSQDTVVITFRLENTGKDVIWVLTALEETVKTLCSLSPLHKKAHKTEH
jgi:cysteine sulfinate desulfinase/cysteine desulfurase-like protein